MRSLAAASFMAAMCFVQMANGQLTASPPTEAPTAPASTPPSGASPPTEAPTAPASTPPPAVSPPTDAPPAPDREAERARLAAELEAEMNPPRRPSEPEPTTPPLTVARGSAGAASASFLDLSFDALAAAGISTASDTALEALQRGDHDPHRRGFTLQNFEITGTGAVDPHFNGEAHLVLKIDREGETTVELEEVFLTTTSLPGGLQFKAGQMYEAFGRQNLQHPHAWQFVEQTLVAARFLGPEGLRSLGTELSWLAPTPWYLLVTGAVYNANGGTLYSFVNEEEPPFYANVERNTVQELSDLQTLGRVAQNFDLGDSVSTTLGASWVHGPNSTGEGATTDIFGADLYLRWKPVVSEQGWPFIQLQGEWMSRKYQQNAGQDAAGVSFREATLWDWGYYAQLVWGFHTRWTTGLRWDNTDSAPSASLPARHRLSPMVTFYPSEFSKVRLQYNVDQMFALDATDTTRVEHAVWLQLEFTLGKHGAHKF